MVSKAPSTRIPSQSHVWVSVGSLTSRDAHTEVPSRGWHLLREVPAWGFNTEKGAAI